MSHRINLCQWEGCEYLATRYVRRGERMKDMLCCKAHTEAFRSLTFADAHLVSAARQPRRSISASITFGPGGVQ